MIPIKAVTFDAGGTLIAPWPSVGAIYAEVAREHGVVCPPERLNARFGEAWRLRKEFTYSRAEWFDVVRHSFSEFREVSPALFDAIYQRFAESRSWLVFDDVVPALRQLKAVGVKLAVISNWDERLVPLLEELRLAAYFEAIIVSGTIGVHKPAREIYEHAARLLSIAPAGILHVGDSEIEDIEGAQAAGCRARCIRRSGVAKGEEVERLSSILTLVRPTA